MRFIVARLDIFNYPCHSVRMSCWIKRLLTYLLNYFNLCLYLEKSL